MFVAGFIGSPTMNFIEVKATATSAQGVTVQLPGGAPLTVPVASAGVSVGDALTLGVRPDHLKVSASGAVAGPVMVVERLGGLTYLYVQLTPSQLIIVHAAGDSPVKVSDVVGVALEPRLAHLFRRDGVALAHLDDVAPSA